LFLLLCSSKAYANYLEFELAADDIGEMIGENATYQSMTDYLFCPTVLGSTYFLDSVEFLAPPDGPFFRQAPASYGSEYVEELGIYNYHPAQVVVPAVLGLKTEETLYDSSSGVNDFDYLLNVDLVFKLTASSNKICFKYAGVESDEPLVELYSESIEEVVGDAGCLPVALDSFDSLLGGLSPAHGGITTDIEGSRLVYRLEYSDDGVVNPISIPLWMAFYNSWEAENTEDWNLKINEWLISHSVVNRITDSISSQEDTTLDEPISSSWTPLEDDGGYFGYSIVLTQHSLDNPFYDLCTPATAYVHMGTDVFMEDGKLVVDGDISIDSLSMNWACEILSFSLHGAIEIAAVEKISIPLSLPGCESWDDGRRFRCEYPIDEIVLDFTSHHGDGSPADYLDAESMTGVSDGLLIEGSGSLQSFFNHERLSGSLDLSYGMSGSCQSGFSCGFHGDLHLDGSGKVCPDGIEVFDDALDVYHFYDSDTVSDLPDTLAVSFDSNEEDFWADPYPLRVLISSTVGGKAFETPAANLPSQQEQTDCNILALVANIDCLDVQAPIPGFFWPWWLVDPPPFVFNDLFLSVHSYSGIVVENRVPVMTANFTPVLVGNGQLEQGSFETCSGTVTAPDGAQVELSFEPAVNSLAAVPVSRPEAQLRDFALEGAYLVEVSCRVRPEGFNDYQVFDSITSFYVNPSALPPCDNDDCDGDGIPNGLEDGDADMDGWPDALDADMDNDGVEDAQDNCPDDWNEDQADMDGDGIGDLCDCTDPPVIVLEDAFGVEEVCTPFGATVEVPLPEIFDTCTPYNNLEIEGRLILSNGVQMDVPFEGGVIELPEGTSVFSWTAIDADGNRSDAEQTIEVRFEPNETCCAPDSSLYLGTSGFNFFNISGGPACLMAYGGADVAYLSGYGTDYIWLGTGNDAVHARPGDNVIIADGGHDFVYFSCGSAAYGGDGWDYLECYGNGDTVVYGQDGNDTISTGGGDDFIVPGSGVDKVTAGAGDDRVLFFAACEIGAGSKLDGGEGFDTLYLPEGMTAADLAAMNVVVSSFEAFESMGMEKAGFATCQ